MADAIDDGKAEKEADVKRPDKFKGVDWHITKEAIDIFCNRLKGSGSLVPLNYILRDARVTEQGAVYATEQEMIVMCTPLQGHQFDRDNERVYGIIKQLMLEGPAWAYKTHDAIEAVHYKGERATFTFDHFAGALMVKMSGSPRK